ncbi:MAG: NADH-quinone oxidoreductase subunit C [Syntrophomonadales bacterium]
MKEVTRDQLLNEVQQMWDRRCRFVTITCVDLIENLDLIYSFDHNLDLANLRVKAEKDRPFPSISGIYSCAFYVENEIQDQFGLKFENLHTDFGGYMLLSRDAPRAPMLRNVGERGKNEDAV